MIQFTSIIDKDSSISIMCTATKESVWLELQQAKKNLEEDKIQSITSIQELLQRKIEG